jgi:hypothetical protein
MDSLENAVAMAERQWPGLRFKRKTANEAAGPCPFCRDGEDRMLIFADRGFFCRVCNSKGWLDKLDPSHRLTPQEMLEMRVRRLELAHEEHERRLSALERMAACHDHLSYHQALDSDDRAYWRGQGIPDEAQDRWLLGVCYRCPTDQAGRPSYTIPVINGGKLVNIRHRLIGADNGDKYRPHMAGLGNTLFNADLVRAPATEIIITEGEKKAIVLTENGFPSVGIMGKTAFPEAWAARFETFGRVYVVLDPDAKDRAMKTAALFGGRGYVVDLPVKADDLFARYHRPPSCLDEYKRWARRI